MRLACMNIMNVKATIVRNRFGISFNALIGICRKSSAPSFSTHEIIPKYLKKVGTLTKRTPTDILHHKPTSQELIKALIP